MIRHYPMARARSLLAGWPVIFDLTKISFLTTVVPMFPPVVRDLEMVRRNIRRKNFGVRSGASIGFKVPHSRALNTLARFYEVDPKNLFRSPFDLSASPWVLNAVTVARSTERDPRGKLDAWRLTDASGAANGNVGQTTLEGGQALRFSYFFRADAPHPTGVLAHGVVENFQADVFWKHAAVINSILTTPAAGFLVAMGVFAWADVAPQGNVDLYFPDARSIDVLPGTDEEILSDLKDKMSSDDWEVDFSLDGGLTWRAMLLEEHEKNRLEDKWIGWSIVFNVMGVDVVRKTPATLDGAW